jgi:Insertion element 4 transposase N-terminal
VQRRQPDLPSRAGVYFVPAFGMFPRLGYAQVRGKLTAGLAGLPVPCPSEKASGAGRGGAQRSRLDLNARTVRVRAAYIERSTGEMLLGPPKSRAGRRIVGVPGVIVPALREHLAVFAEDNPGARRSDRLPLSAYHPAWVMQPRTGGRSLDGVRAVGGRAPTVTPWWP